MKTKAQFLIILSLISILSCNQPSVKPKSEVSPTLKDNSGTPSTAVKPDYNQLAGDYLRSDGVYTLKILSVSADGKLDAAYFNPNPIHVGKAEWVFKNNSFFIMVELRDVNYPGSKYTLQYFPSDRQLAGNYFQAVEKVNYDVVFVRKK
jgi:hypothetical protein